MKDRYLEVTFRNGKPFAAYLHLPKGAEERSVRSEEAEHGMVIDYGPNGNPIGIELTAPEQVTIDRLNQVLKRLNLEPMSERELAPLSAA
ncbi:MAG TPA: DUF2283 domain-containing protein [Nitrospirales bacterium]|jgi:uncharacterized protein YuzE|nr:DUF2283 domain-containing protein [Nitrospirales bacterium]